LLGFLVEKNDVLSIGCELCGRDEPGETRANDDCVCFTSASARRADVRLPVGGHHCRDAAARANFFSSHA
jgi:hypothetical protein